MKAPDWSFINNQKSPYLVIFCTMNASVSPFESVLEICNFLTILDIPEQRMLLIGHFIPIKGFLLAIPEQSYSLVIPFQSIIFSCDDFCGETLPILLFLR
jgi:hypothetical protein